MLIGTVERKRSKCRPQFGGIEHSVKPSISIAEQKRLKFHRVKVRLGSAAKFRSGKPVFYRLKKVVIRKHIAEAAVRGCQYQESTRLEKIVGFSQIRGGIHYVLNHFLADDHIVL